MFFESCSHNVFMSYQWTKENHCFEDLIDFVNIKGTEKQYEVNIGLKQWQSIIKFILARHEVTSPPKEQPFISEDCRLRTFWWTFGNLSCASKYGPIIILRIYPSIFCSFRTIYVVKIAGSQRFTKINQECVSPCALVVFLRLRRIRCEIERKYRTSWPSSLFIQLFRQCC